jgi:hypothetical protein
MAQSFGTKGAGAVLPTNLQPMALLNYTTEIAPEKTVAEIQKKLAQAGASQVLHGYDAHGNLSELSFRIKTQLGELSFRLPANIEAVEAILTRQFKSGRSRFTTREHATKVAWRILKDWVEAQLALLQTGMVTLEQVFLPYVQSANGETLYEAIERKRFSGFLLQDRSK